MKSASSIYKTEEAKQNLMALYEKRLLDLDIEFEEFDVETFAGKTHIIVTGKEDGPPVVLFHGINAGSPMILEAVEGLRDGFRLYGVDTIGQATKSAETRLPLDDASMARWLVEVLDALKLEKPSFIGVSYGAFLLEKLMTHFPERIGKGIFVVPAGLVNGTLIPSIRQISLPLMRFMITKRMIICVS